MVIIRLIRQVCKGASPEPGPLSAQRAISCKYVPVSIGAVALGFDAFCALHSLSATLFSLFVFQCTSLREDDVTIRARKMAPCLLSKHANVVYLQQSCMDAQLAWMMLCAAEAGWERAETNKHGVNFVNVSNVISFNICIFQIFCNQLKLGRFKDLWTAWELIKVSKL